MNYSMRKNLISIAYATTFMMQPVMLSYASPSQLEILDHKEVADIDIKLESKSATEDFDPTWILSSLKTKEGDPFSQITFDQDLKQLSKEYEHVDPSVDVKDGKVFITIKLWAKPHIRQIQWKGNSKIPTKKLRKELDIKPFTIFNKKEFNKAFNKLKELYVKKGYFEAHLSYTVKKIPSTNEVDVVININEGRSAHISKIIFEGLSKEEQSAILHMIHTKKYNLLTSWLTGSGIYEEEKIDQDKLIIVNYLQNQGYADAYVSINVKDDPNEDKIILEIKANKGTLYHFGDIEFHGNQLFSNREIESDIMIQPGDRYSPDKLRAAVEKIKDLYGSKGYIETTVQYSQSLSHVKPVYNVEFNIEESRQYKIGVIRILGNVTTEKSVILNESLLVPGEVFDQRKLKATQERLQNIGYFKSVNVYPVRNPDDKALGPEYRDVIIEVEEALTGNMSLFFGLSSTESIFGGLDITENNFNHKGLTKFWKEGFSSLRGGGEFAQAKISIGSKQSNYQISWLTPYFNDTLWRVGFDINYGTSRVQSKDFQWDSVGFSLYASHPLSMYWSYGWTYRIRNSIIKVDGAAGDEAKRQTRNSGLVSGIANYVSYDSTDNPIKPRRGLRSALEAEIAGVRRHDQITRMFPFLKLSSSNSYYYPLWAKGTWKLRADGKFLYTMGQGLPILLPTNERYYLGGEATVRGYKPAVIGPQFNEINNKGQILPKSQWQKKATDPDPTGGASSLLLSTEYLQNILPPLDAFVFFDAGSISLKEFTVDHIRMSTGFGVRVNVGNRLPMTFGYGYPINPKSKNEEQRFFFAMGGQF